MSRNPYVLAPCKMNKREVAKLVDRVRHGGYGTLILGRMDFREMRWHFTTRSRCAARYAKLTGCTIHEAGLAFGITSAPVWKAWRDLYPGEQWRCKHRIVWTTCAACAQHPNRRAP